MPKCDFNKVAKQLLLTKNSQKLQENTCPRVSLRKSFRLCRNFSCFQDSNFLEYLCMIQFTDFLKSYLGQCSFTLPLENLKKLEVVGSTEYQRLSLFLPVYCSLFNFQSF